MPKYHTTKEFLTGNFRISYPSLFTATPRSKDNPDKLAYQLTAIFPANDPFLLELRKKCKEALIGVFGENKENWPSPLNIIKLADYLSLTGKDGWPLRDGGSIKGQGAGPGTVTVKMTANEDYRPKVVDQAMKDIIDRDKIKGGMICRAVIQCVGFDNGAQNGQGVKITPIIVQLVKDDGVRYSSGVDQSAAMTHLTTIEDSSDNPENYGDDI